MSVDEETNGSPPGSSERLTGLAEKMITNYSNNWLLPWNNRASRQQDPMKLEVLESFMTTGFNKDIIF